jgi:hypothetical protein
MDSLSSAEFLQEYSRVPDFSPGSTVYDIENGVEVENKMLQTPFGPKQSIQVRKPLPNDVDYYGIAYLDNGVSVVDNKYKNFPLKTVVHEDNHQRWEDFLKILHKRWRLSPFVSSQAKEIANRRITDDDYAAITGEWTDSATPYVNMLASSFAREFKDPVLGLYYTRKINKLANDSYKQMKSFGIDVRREYTNKTRVPAKILKPVQLAA